MSIMYRFINSKQHANVDGNVDFPANVDGNVENISIYWFRTTCKCQWKCTCDVWMEMSKKIPIYRFLSCTSLRLSRDWHQQMSMSIEKTRKMSINMSMSIVPANVDPVIHSISVWTRPLILTASWARLHLLRRVFFMSAAGPRGSSVLYASAWSR